MRALRVHAAGDPASLALEELPATRPGGCGGKIVLRVAGDR